MNYQTYLSYIIYLFAFIGFVSIFHYAYDSPHNLLSINIFTTTKNKSFNDDYTIEAISNSNQFLKHIEKCPECILYLFPNKTLVFNIFNNLPLDSQSIFYPLTMKLFYNQPIPYYTILSSNQTGIRLQIRQYWIDSIEKFDSINKKSILYFILQSLKKSISSIDHYSWSNKTKLILYYTKFFGQNYWYNSNKDSVYKNDFNPENCPISYNACHITIDHKHYSHSDALLIHLRESINYKTLNSLSRNNNQRYVFFLKESPVHSPTLSSTKHGHLFNYTQTYRPDSDITGTTLRDFFWLFNKKIDSNYDFDAILKTKETGKLAVAIISNCGGTSSRLKYINELKKYISVDIYGKCGKSCPRGINCRQHAYTKYKFYLAFENSLCDEYVTEKFFFALQSAQVIPVVLGWARYNSYMPSTGYIDVRNFTSPRHLAEYLNYLNKNDTAYLEYFQWRQYAIHIKLPKYMCELCLKLFLDDKDQRKQSLTNIDQYWNKNTQCHNYVIDQNGTWIMK